MPASGALVMMPPPAIVTMRESKDFAACRISRIAGYWKDSPPVRTTSIECVRISSAMISRVTPSRLFMFSVNTRSPDCFMLDET